MVYSTPIGLRLNVVQFFLRGVFSILFDVCTSGGIQSAFVDVYNAASNSWVRYPEGLVQARSFFAATSIPSGAVFFAGGQTSGEWSVFDNITASLLCM